MKSLVGLRNYVIAEVLEDTEEGTEYGTAEKIEGAIDVAVAPDSADPDIQYADDVRFVA